MVCVPNARRQGSHVQFLNKGAQLRGGPADPHVQLVKGHVLWVVLRVK